MIAGIKPLSKCIIHEARELIPAIPLAAVAKL